MLSPAEIAAKYGVTYVSDWAARLRSRLYAQFKDAVTWNGFVTLLARQFQDLEDSQMTLYTLPSVDDSEGVNLDVIGRRVGQQRTHSDDATYRTLLKGRILTSKSEGTPEQIYAIFRALFGANAGLLIIDSPIRSFVLRMNTAVTRLQASIGVSFLRDAKEATTRAILEWNPVDSSTLFRFGANGPGFGVGVFSGADEA